MLSKVISNFQTGWGIAAIRAARTVGIETGGWMPRGFAVTIDTQTATAQTTTETVLRPEYAAD